MRALRRGVRPEGIVSIYIRTVPTQPDSRGAGVGDGPLDAREGTMLHGPVNELVVSENERVLAAGWEEG